MRMRIFQPNVFFPVSIIYIKVLSIDRSPSENRRIDRNESIMFCERT